MTTTPLAGNTAPGQDGTGRWRSVDVSADDAERPLAAAGAWLAAARHDGTVERWFWDRRDTGLSLRLRGAGDADVTALRALLESAGPGVTTTESTYAPDTARCGGPHGVTVWEEHVAASSEIAVQVIGETPSRVKRRRAAGRLLLASAWATGPDWNGHVAWLRGHACSLAGVPEVARARRDAEAAYVRGEAEWLRHVERVRAETTGPGSVTGAWYARQCATWSRLTTLDRAGRLDAAAATVFRWLVRSDCARLGVTPEEEAEVAWLLSLPLAAPGPHEPFFADGPAAVDRQTHEQSKYIATRLPDQSPDLAGATATGRQELGPPLATVPLPRPHGPHPSAPPLEEVLLARRSAYGRYRGPLTRDELSALLYYSAAETADKTLGGVTSRVRTYPSGGGRYPLRLLVYCHDVGDVPRGLYRYDPVAHALDRLGDGDLSADLMRISVATDPDVPKPPKAGGGLVLADCPVWICTVADLTYQRLHYGLRSYRLVLQESGHLAQNLALVATWLGKDSVGLGGFFDDAVNQALCLDGVDSAVLYVHVVGVTDPG
jgi:thiopeptide-type bacteriocin biosynthesis protein